MSITDGLSWREIYDRFIFYDGKIFSTTVSLPPIGQLDQNQESEKNSVSVFSLNDFSKIRSLPGFEMAYDDLTIYDNYLFAINDPGNENYEGQILKQDILNGSSTFINVFHCWIDSFVVINASNIICYSNIKNNSPFSTINYDSLPESRLVILNGQDEKITRAYNFEVEIVSLTISTCKNFVGILFENGLVKIVDSKMFNPIAEFIFEKIIDTDYSTEPIQNCSPYILRIHNGYIYLGHGKELRKYS